MMILTSEAIIQAIKLNEIVICPFDKEDLGTVSYHFHISRTISVVKNYIDSKEKTNMESFIIPRNGLVLYPNTLYLAHTYEKMGSFKYVQKIFGIREVANTGIFIDISANFGHVGSVLNWTLEIKVVQPCVIFPYQKFGQITFWKTLGELSSYNGDYNNRSKHVSSHFYIELNH